MNACLSRARRALRAARARRRAGARAADVLPTGRNLFTVDPRAVPTRTAWEIGSRMAEDLVTRYAQDHGDWPRRVVLDLWGSATMRTGGDDLAQAFALIGAAPAVGSWLDARVAASTSCRLPSSAGRESM